MSRKAAANPRGEVGAAFVPARAAGRVSPVELAALALLLALIPLRAFISEVQSLETPVWTRHMNAPAGPTPATTLMIDGVILTVAVMVAANRIGRGGPRYRMTGAEVGAAVMLAAGVVSCFAASQKRTAVTGVVDFLSLLIYFLTLRQLLRHAWQARLALCVMLATGAAVTYRCYVQVFYDYPETLKHYQENQDAAASGPGNRGLRYDFEQRLKSNAASAFFAHPNVTATYLATMTLTALAVVAARRRFAPLGIGACVAPLLVALGAGGALKLTQSKGAAAALAAGLLLWLIWRISRNRLRTHPRLGWLLAWGLAFGATGGVIAYGVAKNGLPSLSMLYRWQYWRGAAAMLSDLGGRGVGVNNFGVYITRYKPVECPEDVQDPHSWIVRAATEWGALGLVGVLAIWIGVSLRLTRTRAACAAIVGSADPTYKADPTYEAANANEQATMPRSMLLWLLLLSALIATGYLAAHAEALRVPEHAAFVIMTLLEILTVWAAAFALLSVEDREVAAIHAGPLGDLKPVLVIAAIAFLLHSAVDMALFMSGPTMLLFALLAVALACGRTEPDDAVVSRGRRGPAVGIALVGTAAIIGLGCGIVLPVRAAADALGEARRIEAGASWEEFEQSGALAAYLRAAAADPMDGTAVDELLDELLREPSPRIQTLAQTDAALAWVDELRQRDPQSAHADAQAARAYAIRHALSGETSDLRQAIEALERCVQAYPTSPERRLSLGRMWARLAAIEASPALRRRAAEELRTALAMDAKRIYISRPHRFTAEQKAEIEAEARALEHEGRVR